MTLYFGADGTMVFNGGSKVSLRLRHARVLTTTRVVIHCAHAASLPRPTVQTLLACDFGYIVGVDVPGDPQSLHFFKGEAFGSSKPLPYGCKSFRFATLHYRMV